MKISYIIAIVLLFTAFTQVNAGGYHHHDLTVNNYYSSEVIQTAIDKESNKAAAAAIATSQHQFNYGTFEWQVSVAAGWYKSENAVSFAIGKRIDNVLYNGSVITGTDGLDIDGAGVAANWTW